MGQPNNHSRAADAMKALTVFAKTQGLSVKADGIETVAGDLLANLMHLCAMNGVDFDAVKVMAEMHYEAELLEEAEA